MKKSQLIRNLATERNIPVSDAQTVIDTVFDEIANTLSSGNRVELRGFGSFGLKERKGRKGRNPKTGETVAVKPKRVMFFRAGKELRKRVDS